MSLSPPTIFILRGIAIAMTVVTTLVWLEALSAEMIAKEMCQSLEEAKNAVEVRKESEEEREEEEDQQVCSNCACLPPYSSVCE